MKFYSIYIISKNTWKQTVGSFKTIAINEIKQFLIKSKSIHIFENETFLWKHYFENKGKQKTHTLQPPVSSSIKFKKLSHNNEIKFLVYK